MDLTSFVEAIRLYREEVSTVLLVLTAITITYGIGRAGKIIGEVLYPSDGSSFNMVLSWIAGIGRALAMPWYAWSLLLAFPNRRFLGARYLIELEILRPRQEAPKRADYSQEAFTSRHKAWLFDEQERKKRIRTMLSERLKEEPSIVVLLLQNLMRLVGISRAEENKVNPIKVDDFPQLDDSRPVIKRYIEALRKRSYVDRKEASRFLTEVEFKTGYLSPVFLITGLVNRFADEDGWKLILENYRALIEADNVYPEDIRELRSFMFNCWLLWGPSIPACSCEMWEGGEKTDLMMQYGYGDENNSIDILVKNGRHSDFADRFKFFLNRHAADHLDKPFTLAAVPYAATGVFRWGPTLDESELAKAHGLIRGGLLGTARQPLTGRLVFECKSATLESAPISDSSRYYSAYLWVMFVIRDSDGKPFFEDGWKNLLVFFEHANVADGTTYHSLKKQLVKKTCGTLEDILSGVQKGETAQTRGLRISYACSFDDSNCGAGHGSLFEPEKLGRKTQGNVLFEDVSIYALLQNAVSELSDQHILRSPLLSLERAPAAVCNPYSSCHLPEIIEMFYSQLAPKDG